MKALLKSVAVAVLEHLTEARDREVKRLEDEARRLEIANEDVCNRKEAALAAVETAEQRVAQERAITAMQAQQLTALYTALHEAKAEKESAARRRGSFDDGEHLDKLIELLPEDFTP